MDQQQRHSQQSNLPMQHSSITTDQNQIMQPQFQRGMADVSSGKFILRLS
jgi:hypothetical protein